MENSIPSITSIFSVRFSHHQAQLGENHNQSVCCNCKSDLFVQGQGHRLWSHGKCVGKFSYLLLIFTSHGTSSIARRCVACIPWSQAIKKSFLRHIFHKLQPNVILNTVNKCQPRQDTIQILEQH